MRVVPQEKARAENFERIQSCIVRLFNIMQLRSIFESNNGLTSLKSVKITDNGFKVHKPRPDEKK